MDKKRRDCLKCGKGFWSYGSGHRICSDCAVSNQRVVHRTHTHISGESAGSKRKGGVHNPDPKEGRS